jgi:lipoate synthase
VIDKVEADRDKPHITDLFGVYDADATFIGEATYWIGARLGLRHCSLCDITHSLFTEKSEWQQCVAQLKQGYGITFTAFHRDDQPDEVKTVIKGNYPAVVARNSQGIHSLFMDSRQIESCAKSPQIFLQQIIKILSAHKG